MSTVTLFIIAFAISFLGSIPIGMITLAVVERSITRGFKAGLVLSLGATIMEFVYTFLSMACLDAFTANMAIGRNIKISALIIFLLIGTVYLFKKTSIPKATIKHNDNNYIEFLKGVGIGAFNFLIIPFWIFIGVWLKSINITVEENSELMLFSMGAALGALLVFVGYGKLAEYISGKMEAVAKYTNKMVGIVFIILAMVQVFQLV